MGTSDNCNLIEVKLFSQKEVADFCGVNLSVIQEMVRNKKFEMLAKNEKDILGDKEDIKMVVKKYNSIHKA
jgi:predicted XRE-type DNA-binding protein